MTKEEEFVIVCHYGVPQPPEESYRSVDGVEYWPCFGCHKPIVEDVPSGLRPYYFHDELCLALGMLAGRKRD